MADPIDLITANPDENDPANIATEIDLFVQQLKAAIPQLNAAFAAMNFNSTNATSSSSVAIGTGNKNFTTQTDKSYVTGMTLRIANTADETKWMQGEVESYSSGTGALVVNVTHTNGSGTLAAWTISLASRILVPFAGTAKTIVHTGNGRGSTNTRIRRFTTNYSNTLGAYADSATLGGSFTIPASGLYYVFCADYGGSGVSWGVSKNSASLSSDFNTLSEDEKVVSCPITSQSGSAFTYLNAGDVLRMHVSGATQTDANVGTRMIIERLF